MYSESLKFVLKTILDKFSAKSFGDLCSRLCNATTTQNYNI